METMADKWSREGRLKERKESVLQILRHRFQASEEQLQPIQQQLLQIKDGETLSRIVDLSLDAFSLPDFIGKLQSFPERSRSLS